MIEQENGKLRSVAWTELFPWLILFRTFRLAIRARSLIFGALAVMCMLSGWFVLGWIFSGAKADIVQDQIAETAPLHICPWIELTQELDAQVQEKKSSQDFLVRDCPMTRVWLQLSRPVFNLFSPEATVTSTAYSLLCVFWAIVVWAFFGALITRSAAMELAADERVSTRELIGFFKRRWMAYMAAPLFPLLGVLLATGLIFVVGLLLNSEWTMWLGIFLWPLVLVGGLMMAVLLLGLCFGWPLMWATISSEGTDSFDALSRTYAYVFQRPLHYLFYVVVAGLFGFVGWVLVAHFADAIVQLSQWAASWGCGNDQMLTIQHSGNHLGSVGLGTAFFIETWSGCVKILGIGFLYSFFWTSSTAIYFLLRRDVDATEMDEVFLDEEKSNEVGCLPKIGTDEKGAPAVEEAEPESSETNGQPE